MALRNVGEIQRMTNLKMRGMRMSAPWCASVQPRSVPKAKLKM